MGYLATRPSNSFYTMGHNSSEHSSIIHRVRTETAVHKCSSERNMSCLSMKSNSAFIDTMLFCRRLQEVLLKAKSQMLDTSALIVDILYLSLPASQTLLHEIRYQGVQVTSMRRSLSKLVITRCRISSS